MDILLMGASPFRHHAQISGFSMKFPLYSNVLSSMTFTSLSTGAQSVELTERYFKEIQGGGVLLQPVRGTVVI